MNNRKLYFLIGLVLSSAYLLQRAILLLSGNLNFSEVQAQPQAKSQFGGLDISFSYLGMNIYWPFIVALCLLGYKKLNAATDDELLTAIDNEKLLRVSLITILPLFALSFHFISTLGFTVDQVFIALASTEVYAGQQGTIYPPAIEERIAGAAISLLMILSFFVAFYSLFIVKQAPRKAPNKASNPTP